MSADEELESLRTEREKLAAKNRELLAENRGLKDQLATVTATADQQAARLVRYELDAPIEAAIAEVAMPGAESLWRMAFERKFKFQLGEGGVEILTADGQPAMVPVDSRKGETEMRRARLDPRDLNALALASDRDFMHITIGTKGSGSGAGGARSGGGVQLPPKEPEKPTETPPPGPLGLR